MRNRHPDTLTSIISMGGLLQAMGKLEEAGPLFEEALQTCKETLGRPPLAAYNAPVSRVLCCLPPRAPQVSFGR